LLFSAISVSADIEMDSFREMKKLGVERAEFVRDKEEKLLEEHPEMREILRRPLEPGILYRKKLEKLRAYPPDIALQMTDTVRILAIRAQFVVDDDSCTTGNGQFTLRSNGEKIYEDDGSHNLCYDPPHTKTYFEFFLEAVSNYFYEESNGKLVIEYRVVPDGESASYTLPHTMVYYGDPENYVEGLYSFCEDAVEACDLDPLGIQFSDYDLFIAFHAGSEWQTDYFWNSPCDLISATIVGLNVPVNNGAETVSDVVVYPETAFQDFPCSGFMLGGLIHEVAHALGPVMTALGVPDLYDVSGMTIGVGGWALMGTGGWNMNGLVPPRMCAWTSYQLGFLDPIPVLRDTSGLEIMMRASEDTTAPKAYMIPINSHEYFLVENRIAFAHPDSSRTNPDSNGVRVWRTDDDSIYVLVKFNDYDLSLPPEFGEGGLAIWHIEDELAMDDSARMWDTVNMGRVKGIDMEEADGIQDFEKYIWQVQNFDAAFYGSPNDVFFKGNNDAFTPFSAPNTGSYSGGITHLFIDNISESDSLMTFDVSFSWNLPGFPVEVNYSNNNYRFDINSPTIADIDLDGNPEIIVASTGIRVFGVRSDGSPMFDNGSYVFSVMPWYADTIFSSTAVGDFDTLTPGLEVVHGTDEGNIRIWYSQDADSDGYADPFPQYVATNSWVRCAPVMADLDGDGQDEVIVGAGNKNLYAFGCQGGALSMLPGFPVHLGRWIMSTPVVVDSTIYALSGDGRLFAISSRGETLWVALEENLTYTTSSPVAADLDDDGLIEIVVPTGDGKVSCVDETGTVEWSVALPDTNFFSTPAVADIDEDGYLDVLVAAGSRVYGLNRNGASIPYFPLETKATIGLQSSPAVGDIDGDGHLDLVIGSPNDLMLAYDRFGRPLPGFPVGVGDTVFATPALYDLDGDGDIELVTCSDDGFIHVWDATGDASSAVWPMMHRDAKHSGLYLGFVPTPQVYSDLMPRKEFYAYPNPSTDGKVWVRYSLRERASSVDIKVFNVAGDLVRQIEGSTNQGPNDNLLSLDGLASGIYMLRVRTSSGSEEVVRTKKFAVVR
jgi:M6 family metalloprotease-like protein